MSLWGKNDQANHSPIFVSAQFNKTPNTANRDALYGNTTANNTGQNRNSGVFGVSQYELLGTGAGVANVQVTAFGSGYTVVPTVAFSPQGTTNATANAYAGLVDATVAHGGNNYGAGDILLANNTGATAVVNATINVVSIEIRSALLANSTSFGSGYTNGDIISLNGGGTGNAATFTVTTQAANSSVATLAVTSSGRYTVTPNTANVATANVTGAGSGARIAVVTKIREIAVLNPGSYTVLPTNILPNPVVNSTGTGVSANINLLFGVVAVNVTANGVGFATVPGIVFTGNNSTSAQAQARLNSSGQSTDHTGWVLRTVGQGGRAGRIQTEVLVAGGIANDAGGDDATYPGA